MTVRIVLYATADGAARDAARAAFARIADLDAMMSDYRADSELRGLGRTAGDWTPVSAEMFEVLSRALEIARNSDGAFDPTVAPLVSLWREARRTTHLPATTAIDSARAGTGWRHVQLDSARRAVRLALPGMQLDLGAIAKGYILQAAAETMQQAGVRSVLVEAGGDIVVGAPPPGRSGWRIDVPGVGPELERRAHALSFAALSTSGPTVQFVVIDGIRYSHVIDPRSGWALTDAAVVHVIASDGATADALATAIGVLGIGRGAQLAARYGALVSLSR